MDLFIKYVREIPCLWNPLHKSYRDMAVKDEAWRIIVKKLKSPYLPDGKYLLVTVWSLNALRSIILYLTLPHSTKKCILARKMYNLALDTILQ